MCRMTVKHGEIGTVTNQSKRQRCPRCDGFLIVDDLWDLDGTCDPPVYFGLRCVNCGNVLIETITQHRQRQHLPRSEVVGSL